MKFKPDFDDILEQVMIDGELFGLLPIENLGGKKGRYFRACGYPHAHR
jgi:hypothetical protein